LICHSLNNGLNSARLLGNGCCHGNRIVADMSGTWWDATTKASSTSVHWQASYGISNIFQYGGYPPSWIWILSLLATHEVNHAVRLPVKIWSWSGLCRRRYCNYVNYASLAGKCLTTPRFGGFGWFEPLKIAGRHRNPQKAHPWARTRHLSHKRLKSVQGCDLGAVPRKKYNQDRTGQQKSHKSVIFHIFWGKLPVKLLQWSLTHG